MDWREFFASVIGSLAWPVAAVVLVYLLRAQLAGLIGDNPLRRLKVGPGGAELEWEAVAAGVRADVVAAPPLASRAEVADALDVELPENVDNLAEREPAQAITIAWAVIAAEVRRLTTEAGESVDGLTDRQLVKAAFGSKAIPKQTAEAVQGLVVLKDLAANRPETATPQRATDFIVMARAILYAL